MSIKKPVQITDEEYAKYLESIREIEQLILEAEKSYAQIEKMRIKSARYSTKLKQSRKRNRNNLSLKSIKW